MPKELLITIAFLMGVITAIYLPMNSAIARHLGSSLGASIPFFCLALITTLILAIFTKDFASLAKIPQVPVHLYLSGLISAFIILGSTILVPQLGARRFFILFVAGQILMAMLVSHWGILESAQDPITFKKIVGAAVVILGIIISLI